MLKDNKKLSIEDGICYFEEVGSTNDEARLMAEAGAEEGTAVVAMAQTKGRGRPHSRGILGREARRWYSPAGEGLYFSMVLRPHSSSQELSHYVKRAAEVVIAVVKEKLGVEITPEWPNDLILADRKVGGILIEAVSRGKKPSFLILGLGLNLNQENFPPELKASAISLYQKTGNKYDIKEVARMIREAMVNEFC